jgi:hypothetical protein
VRRTYLTTKQYQKFMVMQYANDVIHLQTTRTVKSTKDPQAGMAVNRIEQAPGSNSGVYSAYLGSTSHWFPESRNSQILGQVAFHQMSPKNPVA